MKLQVQPSEFGLEESKAKELIKDLSVTLKEREILKEAFLDVSELEVSEENIPTFKELRLKIVKNRTHGIEKWHKTQKAFYLAGGRFVDAIKNKEIAVNQEMEEKLSDAEKHFENLEKERINKLQLERAEKLSKYMEDIYHIDLGNMDDEIWEAFFNAKKSEHEKRIEEENKAEEERIEREKKEQVHKQRKEQIMPYWDFVPSDKKNIDFSSLTDEEWKERFQYSRDKKKEYESKQEEIRKENERLKKEREAAEAKRLAEEKKRKELEVKKEAEHQAQLKKEREAREKLEASEKARKDAEAKAMEAKKRLEKAPVKEKLNKWVNDFQLPETSVNNDVSKEIRDKFEAFKKWSIKQVNNL